MCLRKQWEMVIYMKKIDYTVMIIITVLYAIVAFKDLGNLKNIETFAELSKGDVIEVIFDKKEKIDTIHYFNGWVEDCDYRLKLKTSKKEKVNEKKWMASAFFFINFLFFSSL